MHINYKKVTLGHLEATCVGLGYGKWESLMKGAVRANFREVNRLVKRDLPELYHNLALNFYNPYNYYRTKRHIILVHSGIEHFITYNQ